MGWRGALRSAAAASRAAAKNRQRLERAARRGRESIDRTVEKLDLEAEKAIAKIQAFEDKVRAKPLSASGATYDVRSQSWSFKEISDNTGPLKWKFKLEFTSDPVAADAPIVDGGRTYEFIGFAATKFAAFVAFKVSVDSVASRTIKLFNKTNPSNNRVFLVTAATTYRALEGQLDAEVPVPGSTISLVAFPLPESQGSEMSIEFLLKSGTARTKLTAQSASLFMDARSQPSLADQFRAKMSAHIDPVHEQAANAKAQIDRRKASGSGCLGVALLVLIVVVIVAIMGK